MSWNFGGNLSLDQFSWDCPGSAVHLFLVACVERIMHDEFNESSFFIIFALTRKVFQQNRESSGRTSKKAREARGSVWHVTSAYIDHTS